MQKKFFNVLLLGLLSLMVSGCANRMSSQQIQQLCAAKNSQNYINTTHNCLYSEKMMSFQEANENMMKKYNFKIDNKERIKKTTPNKKTVVIILTSSSKGNHAANKYYSGAQQIIAGTENINTYILSYPCDYKSTCNKWNKMDQTKIAYPAVDKEYIIEIAEYLKKVKTIEKSENMVVIGHSAGASIATTITVIFPNLINKVIAYEGIYDWNYHLSTWESKNWRIPNVTMINYMDNISKKTKFLFLGGTIETKAHVTPNKSYNIAKKLNKIGIEANVIIYKGESHEMHYNAWVDIVKEINNNNNNLKDKETKKF